MATWSYPFTDTVSNPAPPGAPHVQVGDGRPYTAAEQRILDKYRWARGNADKGVLKGVLNECVVTATGANALQVDTGIVMVNGASCIMETAEALAPTSAGAGLTRKDSVIAQLDLDNSGVGQNKVRVKVKSGTAGAYPALTQNAATVWEQRLYNYVIDDAGAITGISDQRQYLSPAGLFDHGELLGLADDDHTQYYNAARHTAAVHNALNIDAATVGGYSAAALMGGVALGFKGVMVLWGGTIGGSDGHRPIDVITAAAHEDWHLANGQTVNGVVTLDMTNRVPIGAGGTYAVNASGGAATINLQHGHTEGTLDTADESGHRHGIPNLSTNVVPNHTHAVNGYTANENTVNTFTPGSPVGGTPAHAHNVNITSQGGGTHSHSTNADQTGTGDAHNHAVAGTTANALSATQSILPPYRGAYIITYVG